MNLRKQFSRVIALLLCCVLALGLFGCSVPVENGNGTTAAGLEIQDGKPSSASTQAVEQTEEQTQETEALTEAAAATEALTEALTEVATEAPTEKKTEAATKATQKETKKETQKETTVTKTEKELTPLEQAEATVKKNGTYSSKYEVAAYLHLYGKLPSNYITKKDAEAAGWVSSKGNLWKVTDHKSIGGSNFGNYEELLPTKKGRKYYECDIDYEGGKRNAKRIVYSNDGLVFYTEDHYETFEQLY